MAAASVAAAMLVVMDATKSCREAGVEEKEETKVRSAACGA